MRIQIFVQIILCIRLVSAQSDSITFESVKENATIIGIEPFYNQTTFIITECYIKCLQQIEKCSFLEITNIVNEAGTTWWSCMLFHLNTTTQDITRYLTASKVSAVSAPKLPKDCVELMLRGFTDGVYAILYRSRNKNIIKKVYCDMITGDGGGWIVVQRRFDGSVDFNRNWNEYKHGFGDVYGEYWLGNEFIHQYTTSKETGYSTSTIEMIAEGIAFDGVRVVAKMENFKLSDEASKYVLVYDKCVDLIQESCDNWQSSKNDRFTTITNDVNDLSELSRINAKCVTLPIGTTDACRDWHYAKDQRFTTTDQDNDRKRDANCAVKFPGGWWYRSCFGVNLNGNYSLVASLSSSERARRIHWSRFRGFSESLKETRMLLRRKVP